MIYRPNLQDVSFILFDVLQAEQQLAALPIFSEVDAPLISQVLEEAGKFVGEVVAPLNRDGDEIGCTWSAGVVTTPPGFRAAYQQFWQAGWPALSANAEEGGQGLPSVLECILYEWLNGANHGWTMAPGLLHGAYECIAHHASDALKSQYLEKVATGEWLATMCLTESHAGSDLGLARTSAIVQPDGSYQITGEKIFISGGEHDLTDNIVHLVLARMPDAVPGPKGLSLFLAPKFFPDGNRNAVHCDRIEEKMGLHGSSTCAMRFDGARGWLVGEAGRGLNAMFLMMNAARLHVAMQGISALDTALQKATRYANERKQMRAPGSKQSVDFIIEHAAVRRILNTQRAWRDGGRVLAYQTAIELDIAKHHPDADRRAQAEIWNSLLTPVLKAAWTQQGFEGASACLQVFGGHGYIREWGVEQIVRDVRVAMIYEGTNEIQANDLLLRKVLGDGGAQLTQLIIRLRAEIAGTKDTCGADLALKSLLECANNVVAGHALDPLVAFEIAGDFLRVAALAMMAWSWSRISAFSDVSEIAQTRIAFLRFVMPELTMRVRIVHAAYQPA